MAEGRQREADHHTSLLAAPLWQQAYPRKNKKPYEVEDFSRFGVKKQSKPLGIAELKTAFLGKHKKK